MDRKSFVGKKHLTSSRNLGLAISLAVHVFFALGIVAINLESIEQDNFESLEEQSIEINTLSAVELKALVALLESDPKVSEETYLPEPKPEPKPSPKTTPKTPPYTRQ